MTLGEICDFLEAVAPLRLAAEWDNVGLLVGDRPALVARVMTCLTITPAVAAEAIRERANLIVTHHPLPFRPLRRITTDEPTGRLLWDLIRGGVAIYSPHTAWDSAADGINRQLANVLDLVDVAPLSPLAGDTALGVGRQGRLSAPLALAEVAAGIKRSLSISGLQAVGDLQHKVERIAIACGSAGDLLDAAVSAQCDLFVTGETRLHTAYEAEARGIAMLLLGHYASERLGVESLATTLAGQFPALAVWPSRDERDPLVWL
jgi:dinuclear metal center YbgI/SA1388 family protein